MKEWILIITMHLTTPNGAMPDVQIETVDGFTSKQTCLVAKDKIVKKLIVQTGAHRNGHGIKSNTKTKAPYLWGNCILIQK